MRNGYKRLVTVLNTITLKGIVFYSWHFWSMRCHWYDLINAEANSLFVLLISWIFALQISSVYPFTQKKKLKIPTLGYLLQGSISSQLKHEFPWVWSVGLLYMHTLQAMLINSFYFMKECSDIVFCLFECLKPDYCN